jgi:hypothetical protein
MFKAASVIRGGGGIELHKAIKHYSVPKTTVRRFVQDTKICGEFVVGKQLDRKPVFP